MKKSDVYCVALLETTFLISAVFLSVLLKSKYIFIMSLINLYLSFSQLLITRKLQFKYIFHHSCRTCIHCDGLCIKFNY